MIFKYLITFLNSPGISKTFWKNAIFQNFHSFQSNKNIYIQISLIEKSITLKQMEILKNCILPKSLRISWGIRIYDQIFKIQK